MGPGKMWIQRDGALEFLDRLAQITRLAVGATEHDVQLWPVAQTSEHLCINLLRLRELMLLEVRESECIRNLAIVRRDSQRGLQFSSCLIEVSQHEPRLAEHLAGAGALPANT